MTSLVTATPVSVGHEAGSREALLYWQRNSGLPSASSRRRRDLLPLEVGREVPVAALQPTLGTRQYPTAGRFACSRAWASVR